MKLSNLFIPCLIIASAIIASDAAFADGEKESGKDSDISTLNGQLVPVGDQNKYRYSYPRWNIATNPFGMITGTYGLSASFAIHPNIAVRGDVSYSDGFNNSDEGYEAGISAPIYFRKVYNDWFIEPGLMIQRTEVATFDANGDSLGSDTMTSRFGPQVTLGHHWMWDSGFNAAWGLGMGRNWKSKGDDLAFNHTFGTGYLRFGYAF